MMAREKDEGRRAAERKLQEDLGVTPDEAKTILDAHRKAEDDKKTEADKIAEDRRKLDDDRAEVAQTKHNSLVERSVILQGVTDEKRISRIVKILEDDVQRGAKPDDIAAAVTKLKEEMPELFGTGSTPPPPSGGPQGTPPKPKLSDDAYGRGSERAKAANAARSYSIK